MEISSFLFIRIFINRNSNFQKDKHSIKKMNSNELISCKICLGILNQPIRLPCNNWICKVHEKELADGVTNCICNSTHSIPKKGWQIDKIMQNVVNQLNYS
jgi:hypothetical protein